MYKIVITSSNDYKILSKISEILVKKKISPCTHVIKDVNSFYLWENTVVNDNENLLLIKCKESNVIEVEKIISENHNYELPEIISHKFDIISKSYKRWFNDIKNSN